MYAIIIILLYCSAKSVNWLARTGFLAWGRPPSYGKKGHSFNISVEIESVWRLIKCDRLNLSLK